MGRHLLLLAMSAIALATVVADGTPPQVATESEAEPADKEEVLQTTSEEDPNSNGNPQVLKVFRDKEAEDREGKLLAFYTTKTKAVIATSTAFALSTCFSTTNSPSCSGRKRRNIFNDQINSRLTLESSGLLHTSLDKSEPDTNYEQGSENASGRKFTVWSTSFSTYTVVTTSYYQGTTVTVSALCNPGIAASCWG